MTTVASTIVVHNGKVLILQRGVHDQWKPGFWNLPGGVSNPDEKPEQTALREALEETGLHVKNIKLFAIRRNSNLFLWVYMGTTDNPVVNLNFEHDFYVWIEDEKDLKNYIFVPYVRAIIAKALRRLKERADLNPADPYGCPQEG